MVFFSNAAFGDEELPIISIDLENGNIIDLDDGSQFVRVNIEIENYNPQDGYHFKKVTRLSDGETISDSEIQPKQHGDVWTVQILHYIDTTTVNDKLLGDYELEIYSEFGDVSAGTQFSIIRSSIPQITTNSTNEILEVTTEEVNEEESELIQEELQIIDEESQIPDWVRNIFIWYAEGTITETDLLSALEYLINQGILEVEI